MKEDAFDDDVLAIEPIINSIGNLTESRITYDNFIVNMCTIIRNRIKDNLSDKQILENIYSDVQMLIKAISFYYRSKEVDLDKTFMVIFVPNYERLPNIHRRNDNTSADKLAKFTKLILKDNTFNKDFNETIYGIKCYFLVLGNRQLFPHQDIVRYLNRFNGIISNNASINKKYILISHMPIDLHLLNRYPNSRLIESFTGIIKNHKDLGKKIFKLEEVPFNSYTHILFGDKLQILPLAKRKIKQIYLDLAKRDRWNMLPDYKVRDSIITNGLIPELKDIYRILDLK